MRVKTKGYQGEIRKRAKVYSNDPQNNLETINIKAFVKVSIHLSTRYVYLRGLAGQVSTKTVKIMAKEEKELKLVPSQFNLSEKVTYNIEEIEPGKIFKVHFSSIPGIVGTNRGFLKLGGKLIMANPLSFGYGEIPLTLVADRYNLTVGKELLIADV